ENFQKRIALERSLDQQQFNTWLVLELASNNISVHKITGLRDFLERTTGRAVASERTLRRYLADGYDLVKAKVREAIGSNCVFVSIDEATNSAQCRKFATVIVGTLKPDDGANQKVFVWSYPEVVGSWDTAAVVKLFKLVLEELYGVDWKAKAL